MLFFDTLRGGRLRTTALDVHKKNCNMKIKIDARAITKRDMAALTV